MTFGQTLRELREKHNFRQRELAFLLDFSVSTLSMYESGKRSPDLDTLCKIADFFGVSLDYLSGHIDRWNVEILVNGRFTDDTTLLQFLNMASKLTPQCKKLLLRYVRLLTFTQSIEKGHDFLSR